MEDLSKEPQVERELMLIKLNANSSTKGEVLSFVIPIFQNYHSFIFHSALMLLIIQLKVYGEYPLGALLWTPSLISVVAAKNIINIRFWLT